MLKVSVQVGISSATLLLATLCGCRGVTYEQLLASARTCGARQDYECTIARANDAIQHSPTRPEAYFTLGLAYLATGSDRSAATEFSKAISLNPHFTEARLSLGEMMATSADPNV